MTEPRRVISFSCGASSAVLAKIATLRYENTVVVYCDTGGEHESNKRFLREVQEWIGVPIVIIRNPKFVDHFDVFRQVKYIINVFGAACTKRLKVDMKKKFSQPDDIHMFGFTAEEKKRSENFDHRHSEFTEWMLINEGITKETCHGIIWKAGIKIPEMYELGYGHNNCIGCPKGGKGYWNKIRVDFPDHFRSMAIIERSLNFPIFRGDDFLDKMSPRAGNFMTEKPITCGIYCEILHKEINDAN